MALDVLTTFTTNDITSDVSQYPPGLNEATSLRTTTGESPTLERQASKLKRVLLFIRNVLAAVASPPTVAMTAALVIAMVPRLKALFVVPIEESNTRVGTAPDGLPPLSIILETSVFVGGSSIPLGLICLGSALARIRLPRPISRAPLGAIAALSILKVHFHFTKF
jgi:predicted permease